MPMLAVCTKCFAQFLDDGPHRCPTCRARDTAARAVDPRRAGYATREYRAGRTACLARAAGRCEVCGRQTHPTHPDPRLRSLSVNHVDGDTTHNQLGNLRAECGECHPRSDAARRRRTTR